MNLPDTVHLKWEDYAQMALPPDAVVLPVERRSLGRSHIDKPSQRPQSYLHFTASVSPETLSARAQFYISVLFTFVGHRLL